MVTVFNARMAQFIETHRGGKIIEVMKTKQASSEIKLQQLEMRGERGGASTSLQEEVLGEG